MPPPQPLRALSSFPLPRRHPTHPPATITGCASTSDRLPFAMPSGPDVRFVVGNRRKPLDHLPPAPMISTCPGRGKISSIGSSKLHVTVTSQPVGISLLSIHRVPPPFESGVPIYLISLHFLLVGSIILDWRVTSTLTHMSVLFLVCNSPQ